MQLLPGIFSPSKTGQRHAYASLLAAFPEDMAVAVLVDHDQSGQVEEWLSGLRLSCRLEVTRVGDGKLRKPIAWIRDAFLCSSENGQTKYLKTGTRSEDGQAFWLGETDGTPVETLPVALDGGDCLVGSDFWLVGANAIATTAAMAGKAGDYAMAEARLASVDRRRMIVTGFRLSDVNRARAGLRGTTTQTAGASEPSKHSAANRIMQNWAHIDLVVSVTGARDGEGREILLVASTTLPPAPYSAAAATQDRRLDALALHLARNGFSIIRNPVPFASSPKRIFAYNNVIAELHPQRVWLPQFASPDGEFSDIDAANARIWTELGFTVVPVPGWRAFTASDASIRCAANVLRR
jgi:hypothetical protein